MLQGTVDQTAESVLADLVANGVITQEQFDILVERYRTGGFLGEFADIAVTGILGYFGLSKFAPAVTKLWKKNNGTKKPD